ncbi:MAG: asparaginase [Bacteroidetes bacterium]|nr:asparaginase [Bacteroidota bacterium]MDA0930358.1 asparaginase [Bacteroidota bacterium]
MSGNRPLIHLIYTGGTIGSIEMPNGGGLHPIDFEHLNTHIPELSRLDVDIEVVSLAEPKDSSDMRPDDWAAIAAHIVATHDGVDGFVLLHGTDTMAYTASALSFMLQGLKKPVILTGSQLPIGKIRTDGKENVLSAIEVAAAQRNGKPLLQEVAVYFEYKLFRGNRIRKYSTEHFHAYSSPNYPVLAEAGVDIQFNTSALWTPKKDQLSFYPNMDPSVMPLRLFPGISANMLQSIKPSEGIRAVVLETFGFGNAPFDTELLNTLSNWINKGVFVMQISQCWHGSLVPGKYKTGQAMMEMGVFNGKDLTFESAMVKCMHALGRTTTRVGVAELMKQNLAGEFSE